MGRHLQELDGHAPQVVLTTPLLQGIGGGDKMSKSLGNYVGIAEPPEEQFGKLMSIPDDLMASYFALTTGWDPDRVDEVTRQLARAQAGERGELKRGLARAVVDLYHGDGAGAIAEAEFDRVFKQHAAPTDVPEFEVPEAELDGDGRITVARLLALTGLTPSNKEGRRQIDQGGVRLDGEVVTDAAASLGAGELEGRLLQRGKRAWARLRFSR
jgi:tyrosyl-tRNA synthetase